MGAGANVLVNLTNDAWYGRSSAPRHSLAMAILRAVETRRGLARAANTGFSVFISPKGELRQLSPLFAPWATADDVVLNDEHTVYVRFGYLFAPACLFFALLALVVAAVPLAAGRRQKKL
jgi:apolipoprotein N-acyltransferase